MTSAVKKIWRVSPDALKRFEANRVKNAEKQSIVLAQRTLEAETQAHIIELRQHAKNVGVETEYLLHTATECKYFDRVIKCSR